MSQSLKYQRFIPSGLKENGIRKFELWQKLRSLALLILPVRSTVKSPLLGKGFTAGKII